MSGSEPVELDPFAIGGLDAWGDDRKTLEEAFIPIRQFADLSPRNRCFLCGRRGSGKSAIAIMSRDLPLWSAARIIEGEREQYGTYMDHVSALVSRETAGTAVNVRRFIHNLWRYALRIVLLQTVATDAGKMGIAHDSRVTHVEQFLKAKGFWNKDVGDVLSLLFEEAIASAGADEDITSALAWLQQACNDPDFQAAAASVSSLLQKRHVQVVFDTLESYQIHNHAMKRGLQGVISAVLDLLRDELFENFCVRFFIPAEIYEEASLETPAKIATRTVFLRWRTGDLFTLLGKRYLVMLRNCHAFPGVDTERLSKVIDHAVELTKEGRDGRTVRKVFWYETRFLPTVVPNSYGADEDCFAYILRHTQRRPRELIWIMNQIIRHAREAGELPQISRESVQRGLHDPVTLQTLVSDALSPFEGYMKGIGDSARAVLHGRPRVLTGQELIRLSQVLYDVAPVPGIEDEDFLGYLLRAGVVGLIKDPETAKRKGTKCYTPCLFEYLMQGHLAFSKDRLYYVHPAIGDFFEMQRSEVFGPAYPEPQDDTWLEEELGILPRKQ